MTGFKVEEIQSFEYNSKKYKIRKPTQGEILLAQQLESVMCSKNIKAEMITRYEMEQVIKQRNMFGEEWTRTLEEHDLKQNEQFAILMDPSRPMEEKSAARAEFERLSKIRVDIILEKEAMFGQTCEGLARSYYLLYLLVQTLMNEDFTPVWGKMNTKTGRVEPDFDTYLSSSDNDLASEGLLYLTAVMDGFSGSEIKHAESNFLDRVMSMSERDGAVVQDDINQMVSEMVDATPIPEPVSGPIIEDNSGLPPPEVPA